MMTTQPSGQPDADDDTRAGSAAVGLGMAGSALVAVMLLPAAAAQGTMLPPAPMQAVPAVQATQGTPRAEQVAETTAQAGSKGTPVPKASADKTWSRSEIGRKIRDAVVDHVGVEAGKIVASARFVEDLGADSLDLVELVMLAEEEFDIEIPDKIAEGMQTVGTAEGTICRLLGPRCTA